MTRRVDQWVPALHAGDAIGDSALLMRDALRAAGHASDIFTFTWDPERATACRPFDAFREGRSSDVVILHYAIVSAMNDAYARLSCRRILLHHNLTPPEYLAPWDPEVARILREGREGLAPLAAGTALGLGDSDFNRRELEALGFARTDVLPIALDFAAYRGDGPAALRAALDDDRVNLLFVGRIAPNKRPDELIRIAALYKRRISSAVRLILVGRHPRRETGRGEPLAAHYLDTLVRLATDLDLDLDSGEVVFTDGVSHEDLLAYYASAHVFLSASEHEGFGVPLVEAMIRRVPIVAFGGTAVSETLGGAGLVFDERDLGSMAEAAAVLARPGRERDAVLRSQDARVRHFETTVVLERLRAFVASV